MISNFEWTMLQSPTFADYQIIQVEVGPGHLGITEEPDLYVLPLWRMAYLSTSEEEQRFVRVDEQGNETTADMVRDEIRRRVLVALYNLLFPEPLTAELAAPRRFRTTMRLEELVIDQDEPDVVMMTLKFRDA